MARATTKTLLPLDRFAQIIGIDPLHFNQVFDNTLAPTQDQYNAPVTTCGEPIYQWAYQAADRVGREEIARAIADAEQIIETWLGYAPAPKWRADEPVAVARPSNPELTALWGRDLRGYWNAMKLGTGYYIGGGVEAWSAIQNGAAIVYSDTDGDGYFETATLAVPTTVTDPSEISLHYPGMMGAAIQDTTWEVRPIKVSISGGVATITCRREQLVLPELMERLAVDTVDGSDNTKFLTTADVWRHYNDPSQQIQFQWENNSCYCGDSTCATCTVSAQYGCLLVRNPRLSLVSGTPGTWDAASNGYIYGDWATLYAPDRARVWYRAGWQDATLRLPLIQMDPRWERAITYLALSMLDRPLCTCENLQAYTMHWVEDMAVSSSSPSGGTSSYRTTAKQLDNPIGTSRGALYAWGLINQNRIGEAVIGR